MQRKSEELQLAVQEYLDVDWTSVKYYLRRQIAKCVQECKSQASNAKRIAKTIKPSNGRHRHDVELNGDYESEDDSDDWGTDFEDDSEHEVNEEKTSFELNNNTIVQTPPGTLQKYSNSSPLLENNLSHGKYIPKPPDVPVITKSVNNLNGVKNSNHASSIPRPPLKRPPSQPPPPPVAQSSGSDELQEDYEIPIVFTSPLAKENFNLSQTPISDVLTKQNAEIETYELIEPPEEEYEMVDAPGSSHNASEHPVLPPRHPAAFNSTSPPPLPQKPRKLSFVGERPEGIRTFSRPKLPGKPDSETQTEAIPALSSVSPNMGFISSLIGRRSTSTPTSSPKSQHKNKDINEAVISSNASTMSSNESQSSRSSSPDKDGSSTVSEVKKTLLPPLPPRSAYGSSDDTAQNMATRPLPPVPVPKDDKAANNKQHDIQHCPWFREIEREDAEQVVKGLNESGSFVVRPSKRAGKENPYSITILHEAKLFHLNIRHRPDYTFALGKEKKKEKTFPTVADLISYHQTEPILLTSRGEPAGRTILSKYPEKPSI